MDIYTMPLAMSTTSSFRQTRKRSLQQFKPLLRITQVSPNSLLAKITIDRTKGEVSEDDIKVKFIEDFKKREAGNKFSQLSRCCWICHGQCKSNRIYNKLSR